MGELQLCYIVCFDVIDSIVIFSNFQVRLLIQPNLTIWTNDDQINEIRPSDIRINKVAFILRRIGTIIEQA